jgi:hypothetical protein
VVAPPTPPQPAEKGDLGKGSLTPPLKKPI